MSSRRNLEIQSVILCSGSGTPKRGFLYVDNMARACVHVMNLDKTHLRPTYRTDVQPINGCTGTDLTIQELAAAIKAVVGYEGEITFDPRKPDGSPRKLMDC